jgi:hypothetical protein
LPDLLVNSIEIYQMGCRVRVSVENVGDGAAAAFSVSMNGQPQRVPGGLAPAEIVDLSFTGSSITVLVEADSCNELREQAEDNYQGWQVVPMTSAAPPGPCDTAPSNATPETRAVDRSLPDLTLYNLRAALDPDLEIDCWTDAQLGLLITVANYGTVAVDAFEIAIGGQWRATVPGLGPNQRTSVWLPVQLQANYELRIHVDSTQAVPERNETNNWRYIPGANLPITAATPRCTATPGP